MDFPEFYHFAHERCIEFAETDMAGIVHFTNILRYVEATEHGMLRACGTNAYKVDDTQHFGWPRIKVSCNYTRPLRFEEKIEVCLHVEETRNCSLRYRFLIFKEAERSITNLAAEGEITTVYVALDPNTNKLTKMPLPEEMRQALENLRA